VINKTNLPTRKLQLSTKADIYNHKFHSKPHEVVPKFIDCYGFISYTL